MNNKLKFIQFLLIWTTAFGFTEEISTYEIFRPNYYKISSKANNVQFDETDSGGMLLLLNKKSDEIIKGKVFGNNGKLRFYYVVDRSKGESQQGKSKTTFFDYNDNILFIKIDYVDQNNNPIQLIINPEYVEISDEKATQIIKSLKME